MFCTKATYHFSFKNRRLERSAIGIKFHEGVLLGKYLLPALKGENTATKNLTANEILEVFFEDKEFAKKFSKGTFKNVIPRRNHLGKENLITVFYMQTHKYQVNGPSS